CLAVESGGSDEVAFNAVDMRQFPGALRERQRLAGLTEPEAALCEIGVDEPFTLFVFLCNPDIQRTAKSDHCWRGCPASSESETANDRDSSLLEIDRLVRG